jgi:hypothetical protein
MNELLEKVKERFKMNPISFHVKPNKDASDHIKIRESLQTILSKNKRVSYGPTADFVIDPPSEGILTQLNAT